MIKWLRQFVERGRKGFVKEEMWSFDNWLSELIANGLREFKQDCHTYPNDIGKWEDWMAILDEMIECFEEQTRNIDTNFSGDYMERWQERRENQRRKLHRGFELLERYYYDLWV